MRSRAVREGSVGLLILLSLICIAVVSAWLRGAKLGGSYSLAIELTDAVGLDVGSSVKYRGVKVGRVSALTPSINGVVAEVAISPPSIVIPRNSTASVTQSGFIGQVELSIQPSETTTKAAAANLSPYKPKCNESVILCDGDRLVGTVGPNFDMLIKSTTKLANLLTEDQLIDNANVALKTFAKTAQNLNVVSRSANKTLKDVSNSAGEFNALSQETRQELRQLGPVVGSVGRAVNRVGAIGNRLDTTAADISTAANQVTSLVATNRGSVINTLGNLQDASQELKVAVSGLSPVINRLEKGKLLNNLEALAENGAKATANLNSLTSSISDPATVLGLVQTLDSARVTFQNTQKITTDLEQVTGSPNFRQNIIKLINGLSKLVSSSQILNQQLNAMYSAPARSPVSRAITPSESQGSDRLGLEQSSSQSPFQLSLFSDKAFSAGSALRQPTFTEPALTQSLNPQSLNTTP